MITIITAVPGSGKTLFSVELIDKEIKKIVSERKKDNPDDALLNRRIYHNIDGLIADKFADSSLIDVAPDDWRDTPDGSLIIYDEAWQLFPATSKRDITDDRLSDLSVHRHSGHDIIFIVQHPSQLHTLVRNLCNRHIHLYRMFGGKASTVYTWQHLVTSPNSRSEQQRADKYLWKFPKEYFSYYKSATVHTHKFRLPRKLVYFIVSALVIFSFVAYNYLNNDSIVLKHNDDIATVEAQSSTQRATVAQDLPVGNYSWAQTPKAEVVNGCIANTAKNYCMCFGKDGHALNMSHAACLSIIDDPIPHSMIINRSGTS